MGSRFAAGEGRGRKGKEKRRERGAFPHFFFTI